MEMLKNWINFILTFICLVFLLGLLVGCDNNSHEQQQQLMTQQQQLMQQMEQQQMMINEIEQLKDEIKQLKYDIDYCYISYIFEILN